MDNEVKKELPNQVEGLPLTAVVDVKISGSFYSRLHQMLMWHSQKEGLEKFTAALAELEAGEPKTEYAYHLETLLTLIFEIEKKGKEQNLIKQVDLPEQPTQKDY